MLRRGASLAVVTLTNQAQLTADLVVVGLVLGAAGAGDYYLAGQVLVAGLLFANAAGQIALARLSALAGDPLRFRAALLADLRHLISFAAITALGIGCVAATVVPVLFGAEHAGAAQALLWLLPWFVLQHPTTLLQAALTAARREGQVVRANGVAIAVLLSGLAVADSAPGPGRLCTRALGRRGSTVGGALAQSASDSRGRSCSRVALIRTLATPDLTIPSAWAARRERSIIRPPVNGPRSLTSTVTDRPLASATTVTLAPRGSVGWAAVSAAGS